MVYQIEDMFAAKHLVGKIIITSRNPLPEAGDTHEFEYRGKRFKALVLEQEKAKSCFIPNDCWAALIPVSQAPLEEV